MWLARDRLRDGSIVALKELSDASRGREETLKKEFATLSSLRHPGVAEVFELDADPLAGLPRFSLEYVEGDDFVSAVRREGARALLDLTAEALQALAFLHDFGVIHRDLKPANLLVRNRPRLGSRLVVLDFGLAMGGGVEQRETVGFAGTLPYVAPELFEGAAADRRSDLYALGIVVYESVHGRPPYLPGDGGRDIGSFVEAVRHGRRSRPAVPPDFPEGIGPWIEGMIAVDCGVRPAGAAEALARLNAACGTDYRVDTAADRRARLMSGAPVGRDAELAALWRELEKADGPTLVWVTGGAGCGKSRLLRWVATDGVVRGFDVVVLGEELFGERRARDDEAVESVLSRLRQRAAQRPTVVIVDEVETAGSRVASFLERVAREPKAPPLRVVAALRPGELRQPAVRKLFEDTGFVPSLRRVDLAPLGLEGLRAFAERAAGHGPVSEPRLRWLLEASEGNPLVAEALLVEGPGGRGRRARASLSISESVATRLELLPEAARRWLEGLCLLGEGSDGETVGKLAGLDAAGAGKAASEVAAVGLAVQRGGLWFPESRAVVEQIRQGLAPARSRELYRRAAGLAVEAGGEAPDPWRLARLWAGAGESEEAARCALRAAQMEEQAGRPHDAAERYGFALRQIGRRDARRRELRLKQGEAFWLASSYQAAARAFGSAVRFSQSPLERAEALVRQAEALVRAGRPERARRSAEEAREIFERAGERSRAAEAQCSLATVLVVESRHREALDMLLERWDDLLKCSDRRSVAAALHIRALCESALRLPEAESHFARAMEIYSSFHLPQLYGKVAIGLAEWYRRGRRLGEARALLERFLQSEEGKADRSLCTHATSLFARVYLTARCFDRAISYAREAELAASFWNLPSTRLDSIAKEANALTEVGRASEAVQKLQAGIEALAEAAEPVQLDFARTALAEAMMATGEDYRKQTRELIERALAGGTERKRPALVFSARTCELRRCATYGDVEAFERAWGKRCGWLWG